MFGFEITIFSDHKNIFLKVTLILSQNFMQLRLTLEFFGSNIQHIAVLGNIVANALNRMSTEKYHFNDTNTIRSQHDVNWSIFN